MDLQYASQLKAESLHLLQNGVELFMIRHMFNTLFYFQHKKKKKNNEIFKYILLGYHNVI